MQFRLITDFAQVSDVSLVTNLARLKVKSDVQGKTLGLQNRNSSTSLRAPNRTRSKGMIRSTNFECDEENGMMVS